MLRTPYKTRAIAGHAIGARLPLFAGGNGARAGGSQSALLLWIELRRCREWPAGQAAAHPKFLSAVALRPARAKQEPILRLQDDAASRKYASSERFNSEFVR